jgi:hypothetical protein
MRKFLIVLCLAACGDNSLPVNLPATDHAYCVTLGADYKNNVGALTVLGLPSMTLVKDVLHGAVSGDPVVRALGGKLYIVNRTVANVTVIDPTSWTVERQFSTGANTNPQDIALSGSKAYVALLGSANLQVWDLSTTSNQPAKTIDLGSYDSDGVPEANSVVVSGGKAYVTLELLGTDMMLTPRGPGKVVVIDTQTDMVTGAFDLHHEDPLDFMFPRGDGLVVATTGDKGCLEQVVTGASPHAGDCLVKNDDLDGTVSAIAVGPTDTYLAVSAFDFSSAEIRRLGSDGKLADAALTPTSEQPGDVAYAPTGHIVYNDFATNGVRVYDLTQGKEITSAALNIGLTPAGVNGIVCLAR